MFHSSSAPFNQSDEIKAFLEERVKKIMEKEQEF